MSDHKSTQDLIGQIERKDRRFRMAQGIFMLATLVALIMVIWAQQRTLNDIKVQAANAAAQSDDQRDKIIRRLNCVVVFLSQTDRTNLSIADIDKCALNRDKDIQQFFAQPEKTPAEKPPNLAPSTPPATGGGAISPAQNPTPTPITVGPPVNPPPLIVLPSMPQPCLSIAQLNVCVGQ